MTTKRKEDKARKLGRPSKDLGRDSHALILDAALELFSSIGYEAATMKKIADRVGIRDSAVYAHFESKADIREQIFRRHGPNAIRMDFQNVDFKQALLNPRAFTKSLLSELAKRWLGPSENRFFRYMLMENLRSDTQPAVDVMQVTDDLRDRLKGLATLLMDQGKLRRVDAEWLVGQFVAPILAIRFDIAFRKETPHHADVEARFNRHVDEFFAAFGLAI